MANLAIQTHFPNASQVIYGCMGLGGGWNQGKVGASEVQQAENIIDVCLSEQINFFDHADIYAFQKAEIAFGGALKNQPTLREKMILQSKCGIRLAEDGQVKHYDLSKDWIIKSVEGILSRLNTEYLDILLLHRPDPLMQPDEIAEAFSILKRSGKVDHFGVSNMHSAQVQLIQSSLDSPLVANQLEMSLAQLDWLNEGITACQPGYQNIAFSAGTIEHSMMNAIQLQSWGCLAQGLFSGRDVSNQSQVVQATANLVSQLALKYQTSLEAIVLAFLFKHPMNMQAVIGTTDIQRIKNCTQVANVNLSKMDWYLLFETARGAEMP